MNVLYLGDVMAEPGLALIEKVLPALKQEYAVELVIAQAENVSEGKGITPADFVRMKQAGVDFCSGGNHTFQRPTIFPQLNDPNAPIIRPANYPEGSPGLGYKYYKTSKGPILIISLLGRIVGKDADLVVDNPLRVVDDILKKEESTKRWATFVNFHGDFSSEKRIIGYYLDGRVTAVIGDHWHIQTADADVLPKGTAHITDVGMCGSLDSSLGVTFSSLIPRWRDGIKTRNVLERDGRMQLNALCVEVDETTGLATQATAVRRIY